MQTESTTTPDTRESTTNNGNGLLSNGGIVLVVGVTSGNLPDEWRDDARIRAIDVSGRNRRNAQIDIPTNTRAVMLTRFVSHQISEQVIKAARARRLTIFPGLQNTGEIKRALATILHTGADAATGKPVSPGAAEKATRGALSIFLDGLIAAGTIQIGPAANIADEARKALPLAIAHGITSTTANSIAGALRGLARKRGVGARPASVSAPPDKLTTALQTLDDGIAALQVVREYVADTSKRNAELEERIANITRLLSASVQ